MAFLAGRSGRSGLLKNLAELGKTGLRDDMIANIAIFSASSGEIGLPRCALTDHFLPRGYGNAQDEDEIGREKALQGNGIGPDQSRASWKAPRHDQALQQIYPQRAGHHNALQG